MWQLQQFQEIDILFVTEKGPTLPAAVKEGGAWVCLAITMRSSLGKQLGDIKDSHNSMLVLEVWS